MLDILSGSRDNKLHHPLRTYLSDNVVIGLTNRYNDAKEKQFYLAFIGVSATLIIIFSIIQLISYINWETQRKMLSWLMCFFSLILTFAIAIVLAITTSAIHLLETQSINFADTRKRYDMQHNTETTIEFTSQTLS